MWFWFSDLIKIFFKNVHTVSFKHPIYCGAITLVNCVSCLFNIKKTKCMANSPHNHTLYLTCTKQNTV